MCFAGLDKTHVNLECEKKIHCSFKAGRVPLSVDEGRESQAWFINEKG